MHRPILGAGLALGLLAMAAAAQASPAGRCPAPQARLTESFIAADCTACWAADAPAEAAAGRPGRGQGWQLDWITPAGEDADMAVAALPEAAERQARARAAGAAAPPLAEAPARRPAGSLQVQSGPAWNGYFGVQINLRPGPAGQAWPVGATAWIALVEQVSAGSEGTAVARALVRSVAGPLPLPAAGPVTHLRALRWPPTARPERLQARGWVELADGRVLLMAADRCPPG